MGFMAILVFIVFGSLFYFDLVWRQRTETFYLLKDSCSILVLLIICPSIVIAKNENMKNHLFSILQPLLKLKTTMSSIFHKNIIGPF